MTADSGQAVDGLMRMIGGFRISHMIATAARLRIPDLLASGPMDAESLARETSAHEDSLYRLLRALASVGVLEEADGRLFRLQPLAEPLRTDHPQSVRDLAILLCLPYSQAVWSDLPHSILTGETAFAHVHGVDLWQYREAHPDMSAIFDAAMSSLSRLGLDEIVEACDLGETRRVMDVGGGRGLLLSSLLKRYHQLEGVLFDQAHVIDGAEVAFRDVGLGRRARLVAGDFFESVPAGADAIILKHILHGWPDAESVRILTHCKEALPPGGRVMVIEWALGGPNETPVAKLMDINMLVGPGGRERTVDEYAALFAAAGLTFDAARPAADHHVLEASA